MRIKIVRGEVCRWSLLDRRLFARRDFGLKLRYDLPGYLAFDYKYVRNIAIVPFRPNMHVCAGIDQLSANPHPSADALHATLEHMCDTEFPTNIAQVSSGAALVLHCRCAADHSQIGHFGQTGQDFVLHTTCEISVLFLIA